MSLFPTLPIPVGFASTATDLAPLLGREYPTANGKKYRLVKAAAAIAAAAEMILVSAASSGAFTWSVNTSTTANDYLARGGGIVPAGQVGSTGTTGLVSGDYFLIQTYGPASVTSAAAIAAGVQIGCSTTAGKADDATVAAGVGGIAISLESAAGADESVGVFLF